MKKIITSVTVLLILLTACSQFGAEQKAVNEFKEQIDLKESNFEYVIEETFEENYGETQYITINKNEITYNSKDDEYSVLYTQIYEDENGDEHTTNYSYTINKNEKLINFSEEIDGKKQMTSEGYDTLLSDGVVYSYEQIDRKFINNISEVIEKQLAEPTEDTASEETENEYIVTFADKKAEGDYKYYIDKNSSYLKSELTYNEDYDNPENDVNDEGTSSYKELLELKH